MPGRPPEAAYPIIFIGLKAGIPSAPADAPLDLRKVSLRTVTGLNTVERRYSAETATPNTRKKA
jgi:hypothetical protein